MKSFAILFSGRCGGTWLFTILGQSGFVNLQQECLQNIHDEIVEKEHGAKVAEVVQKTLMREFMRKCRYDRNTAYGFITQFKHVRSYDDLGVLLQENEASIISLTRENIVKQALSFITGDVLKKETGVYHIIRDNPKLSKRTVFFAPDPNQLLIKARECKKWTNKQKTFVDTLGLPVYRLTYERMCKNIEVVTDEIFDFLRISDRKGIVTNKLIKNMDDDLTKALANYEQVRDRFKGTQFAKYFEGEQ